MMVGFGIAVLGVAGLAVATRPDTVLGTWQEFFQKIFTGMFASGTVLLLVEYALHVFKDQDPLKQAVLVIEKNLSSIQEGKEMLATNLERISKAVNVIEGRLTFDKDWLVTRFGEEVAGLLNRFIVKQYLYYSRSRIEINADYPPGSGPVPKSLRCTIKGHVEVVNGGTKNEKYPFKLRFGDISTGSDSIVVDYVRFALPNEPEVSELRREDLQKASSTPEPRVFVFAKEFNLAPGDRLTADWQITSSFKLDDRYVHRVRYPTRTLELNVRLPKGFNTDVALFHPADELPESERKKFYEKSSEDGAISVKASGVLPFWAVDASWQPRGN